MNHLQTTRRDFLKTVGLGAAAIAVSGCSSIAADSRADRPSDSVSDKPNFIIVFTDDQGYQDIGCFGSPSIKTPNLDKMADEGVRFTSFYAQTVCGPSRAALMTGCYPLRVAKRNNQVDVHPYLHTKEITVAEVLKDAGYATACFGKWDLAGHRQKGYDSNLLPTRQGFDYFFGTPTSNDSVVNLLRNEQVIERSADMNTLTRRYTDEAIAFIRANKDKPFFIYIPHTMPHTKLGASDEFRGKSKQGLYGDVIEEIDHNVGRILSTVKELALDKKTYVIFTSDNGPWEIKKAHGGSALPLRGAKTSTWEGGLRVPCIMRAPGRIPPATVCDEIASTMDILPTLAKLAGTEASTDRVIDGHDIAPLMHGQKGATSPTEAFYYYQHTHLQAVRSGKWKLHLPRPANPPWTPNWARHIKQEDVFEIKEPLLFDLQNDIGEQTDVAKSHPDVVARLLELGEKARADIGDYNRVGAGARFFDPQPKRPDIVKWLNK
ncbi:MAG: sulfatase-like hydrolase/transferase [Planctomycetota bacterium]|jgi:arylsulfatase